MDDLLLIKAAREGSDSNEPALLLNGQRWIIVRVSVKQSGLPTLDHFMCVSYIWGSGRVPNPTTIGPQEISDNTIPALTAAMQNTDITAFWIDAFCIPTQQHARAASLESMGYIYSQAKEVRAVLAEPSFNSIVQLIGGDKLDDNALRTLEEDRWVNSVWTYQEVVNSQSLGIVCSGAPGAVVNGSHFLNGLGNTIAKYKNQHQMTTFEFHRQFPSLDALEDLIADWMIAEYGERSALVVMSSMDRRTWTEEKNYFYAMIGAITTESFRRSQVREQHLAETFMQVCESKGDFSFIYSSVPRSTRVKQAWRPQIGLLPSVLPWHSWGSSQPGYFDASGELWLDQVIIFRTSTTISTEARRHLADWLHKEQGDWESGASLRDGVFEALVGMGFTGSQSAIEVGDGFFFPQVALTPGSIAADMQVIVSAVVRWTIGAPGLVQSHAKAGLASNFTPGVFAGIVNKGCATSVSLI